MRFLRGVRRGGWSNAVVFWEVSVHCAASICRRGVPRASLRGELASWPSLKGGLEAPPQTPAPGVDGISLRGLDPALDGEPLDHSELLRSSVLWVPGSDLEYNYPIACFTIIASGTSDRRVSCILISARSPSQTLLPVRAKAQCLALA